MDKSSTPSGSGLSELLVFWDCLVKPKHPHVAIRLCTLLFLLLPLVLSVLSVSAGSFILLFIVIGFFLIFLTLRLLVFIFLLIFLTGLSFLFVGLIFLLAGMFLLISGFLILERRSLLFLSLSRRLRSLSVVSEDGSLIG